MNFAETRNRAMTGALRAAGVLTDDRLEAAMVAVPRHLFAPAVGWLSPDNTDAPGCAVDRQYEPDAWWSAVYSDGSIITQRDDGASAPDAQSGTPTSSLSAPGVVAQFLGLLEVRAHHHVLEIGTGSGWTAALLTHLTAAGLVTSIEVDPQVADSAAANLKAAGCAPHLIVGDGAAGWPDGAPYDRVHVTCAVARVPYAWVEQTRLGGVIVAPWQPGTGGGFKLRLTVDQADAVGTFHGTAGYMMMREHRRVARWNPHHQADATTTRTRLDPRDIERAGPGLSLALIARSPGLGMMPVTSDDGSWSLLMFEIDQPEGAWASCDWEPGTPTYQVTQYGDRALWREAEDTYQWWLGHQSPGIDRYGLTVTPQGEWLWLDSPQQPIHHRDQ